MLLCGLSPADENDLAWSTFLGGSGGEEGRGIALLNGCVYVVGGTWSDDFPLTAGALDTSNMGGYYDAFVTKLNPQGSALVFSTYLGGEYSELGYAIALDDSGNIYVTGHTDTDDFPTTPGAFQPALASYIDVFVAKLSPSGDDLKYATYLGGNSEEQGRGIAVDVSGDAYVTGYTLSDDFPATLGAFDPSFDGGYAIGDAFVARLNSAGDTLAYATFLSGENMNEEAGFAIAVDDSGYAYVTGFTTSADFPTTSGAFDTTNQGYYPDAFVSKLNPAGSNLVYSTYLGSDDGNEIGYGIALNDSGNVFVTGVTDADDFPTTAGAYDPTFNGSDDVFVCKFAPSGGSLAYSTYIGAGSTECGHAIALDALGCAHVIGYTYSDSFPTTPDAFDTTYADSLFYNDIFLTKLTPSGGDLEYSTFLGGWYEEDGLGIAVDDSGKTYATGYTLSEDFPVTAGAFDSTFNGSYADVFVVMFDLGGESQAFPPQAPANLTVALAQDDIRLDWSAVTIDISGHPIAVDSYNVYRDTVAFFGPGSDPFDGAISLSFTDTSAAAGNISVNYFYSVTAISGDLESQFSGVVGELDAEMTNSP